MKIDPDIQKMDEQELRVRFQQLRDTIRTHRDEREHGRCWLDDIELYKMLPDKERADFTLPPEDEFLTECKKFWKMRKTGTTK